MLEIEQFATKKIIEKITQILSKNLWKNLNLKPGVSILVLTLQAPSLCQQGHYLNLPLPPLIFDDKTLEQFYKGGL